MSHVVELRFRAGINGEDVVVRAPGSAIAYQAIQAGIEQSRHRPGFELGMAILEAHEDPDIADWDSNYFWLDQTLTVDQVRLFFGPEISQAPATYALESGGIGGDRGDVLFLHLNELLTIAGNTTLTYATLRAGWAASVAVMHRNARAAVREWDESGDIPSALLEVVGRRQLWPIKRFMRIMGISEVHRASALLRAAGYERADSFDGTVWWSRAYLE